MSQRQQMEGYISQIRTMKANGDAWRKANPDKQARVQFNYGKKVMLVAPISTAIEQHYVSVNAAGLELVKALWPWEDSMEPTVFMVRMALELEDEPKKETQTMKMKKIRSRAEFPAKGYHFCAAPKCKTQIRDGAPELCPKHFENACLECHGRGKKVWSHNEADSPPVKFKKCKACRGTGQTLPGKKA